MKDPAFLFYPGDYLRDTQCLSEPAQVAYDRIMCEHMRNICISHERLKFFTKKLSSDEINEIKSVLTEVEGGFKIDWVAESVSKRKAYSESRRSNRSGKDKEDMNNISETYVEHMENENVIEKEIVKEKRGVGKKTIPEFDEFLEYALEKEPNLNHSSVKLKYDAWIENGWKNGNGKDIKNWKSNLNNTIPYLQKNNPNTTPAAGQQPNIIGRQSADTVNNNLQKFLNNG